MEQEDMELYSHSLRADIQGPKYYYLKIIYRKKKKTKKQPLLCMLKRKQAIWPVTKILKLFQTSSSQSYIHSTNLLTDAIFR